MIVPILIGLATTLGLGYAMSKESKDGDKKPSLDEIKEAEYKRGHAEASAVYDAKIDQQKQIDKARSEAVKQYRLDNPPTVGG